MKRVRRRFQSHRTLQRLLRIATRGYGSDRAWKAIEELLRRGQPQTLEALTRLAGARNWRKRATALSVAGQLHRAQTRSSYHGVAYGGPETQRLLSAGLDDDHERVIEAAVFGLGHRGTEAALERMLAQEGHPAMRVRFALVYALDSYKDDRVTDMLMRLALDPTPLVRDWATFALGSQQTVDSPALRALFWRNLQDVDEDVRGEALVGLAERRDLTVIPVVIERLTPDCQWHVLNAARILADPQLLPTLLALWAQLEVKQAYLAGELNYAIEACGGIVSAA